MQKKIWIAVLIGIITGLLIATVAAYFLWETTKHACTMHVQEQEMQQPILKSTEIKPEEAAHLPSKSSAIIVEQQTPTASGLPKEIPSATQTSPQQTTLSTKNPTSATKKKQRRNRRRKKVVAKEASPVVETTTKEVLEPVIEFQSAQPITANAAVASKNTTSPTATQISTVLTAAQTPVSRMLHVHNHISLEDLSVKHWTGTYTPTKLDITINDVPFTIIGDESTPHGSIKNIACSDNCIKVEYAYEFMNGMRKGADTVTYSVGDSAQELNLLFSWDTPWHVELAGAERKE
jgi:hypothetical protein